MQKCVHVRRNRHCYLLRGGVGYEAGKKALKDDVGRIAGEPVRGTRAGSSGRSAIGSGSVGQEIRRPRVASSTYVDPSQVTLSSRNQISMSDRENSIIWKQEQCMTIYRNIEQIIVVEGGSSSENLRRFMASLALALDKLELATTATFFAQEITEKAGAFLMKSENLVPITQLQHSKVSVR
ncbi:putative Squalestatin hexaketide synthase [Seiridium cardinale]